MEMLIGGTWQPAASGRTEDVTSPFDGTVTGTVPVAGDALVTDPRVRKVSFTGSTATGEHIARIAGINGLGTGIFTSDVSGAVRAIREIDAGNVHINWTPLWRADLMPYGGLKASGIGHLGPRSAVAVMTDTKTVILHGRPW